MVDWELNLKAGQVFPDKVDSDIRKVCEKYGTGWLIALSEMTGGGRVDIPQPSTIRNWAMRKEAEAMLRSGSNLKQIRQKTKLSKSTIIRIKKDILSNLPSNQP